jgi:chromosome segregation ATPase
VFVALLFARMLCEGVPLTAGIWNDKKTEKSGGFWCKNSFRSAFSGCFNNVKNSQKEVIQERVKSSSLMIQVSEVSDQLMALTSQSLALDQRLSKMMTKLDEQQTRLPELKAHMIQNTDHALKNQWCTRIFQLGDLVTEATSLTGRVGWFNIRVDSNISTQNPDFSAVRNDIAEWKTAFAALEAKVTDFEKEMDKPLLLRE